VEGEKVGYLEAPVDRDGSGVAPWERVDDGGREPLLDNESVGELVNVEFPGFAGPLFENELVGGAESVTFASFALIESLGEGKTFGEGEGEKLGEVETVTLFAGALGEGEKLGEVETVTLLAGALGEGEKLFVSLGAVWFPSSERGEGEKLGVGDRVGVGDNEGDGDGDGDGEAVEFTEGNVTFVKFWAYPLMKHPTKITKAMKIDKLFIWQMGIQVKTSLAKKVYEVFLETEKDRQR
jgi:hypothetical protein